MVLPLAAVAVPVAATAGRVGASAVLRGSAAGVRGVASASATRGAVAAEGGSNIPKGALPGSGRIAERTIKYLEDGRPQYYLQKLFELKAHFSRENRNLKITKENKPGIIGYGPIFMVAALKDLLDLTVVFSLPGISFIVSFIFGVVIYILLVSARTNYNLVTSRALLRRIMKMRIFRQFFSFLMILLAFLVEGLAWGINLFPIETLTVLIIFLMDRSLSDKQIQEILKMLKLYEAEYASTASAAYAYRAKPSQLLSRKEIKPGMRRRETTASDNSYRRGLPQAV